MYLVHGRRPVFQGHVDGHNVRNKEDDWELKGTVDHEHRRCLLGSLESDQAKKETKFIYIYLFLLGSHLQRQGETEKDLPSASSLPKWLQWLELS